MTRAGFVEVSRVPRINFPITKEIQYNSVYSKLINVSFRKCGFLVKI